MVESTATRKIHTSTSTSQNSPAIAESINRQLNKPLSTYQRGGNTYRTDAGIFQAESSPYQAGFNTYQVGPEAYQARSKAYQTANAHQLAPKTYQTGTKTSQEGVSTNQAGSINNETGDNAYQETQQTSAESNQSISESQTDFPTDQIETTKPVAGLLSATDRESDPKLIERLRNRFKIKTAADVQEELEKTTGDPESPKIGSVIEEKYFEAEDQSGMGQKSVAGMVERLSPSDKTKRTQVEKRSVLARGVDFMKSSLGMKSEQTTAVEEPKSVESSDTALTEGLTGASKPKKTTYTSSVHAKEDESPTEDDRYEYRDYREEEEEKESPHAGIDGYYIVKDAPFKVAPPVKRYKDDGDSEAHRSNFIANTPKGSLFTSGSTTGAGAGRGKGGGIGETLKRWLWGSEEEARKEAARARREEGKYFYKNF